MVFASASADPNSKPSSAYTHTQLRVQKATQAGCRMASRPECFDFGNIATSTCVHAGGRASGLLHGHPARMIRLHRQHAQTKSDAALVGYGMLGKLSAARPPCPGSQRCYPNTIKSHFEYTRPMKECVQEAAQAGCCMAFLPECFNFIGRSPADTVKQAAPLTSPAMQQYCALARCAASCTPCLHAFSLSGWFRACVTVPHPVLCHGVNHRSVTSIPHGHAQVPDVHVMCTGCFIHKFEIIATSGPHCRRTYRLCV